MLDLHLSDFLGSGVPPGNPLKIHRFSTLLQCPKWRPTGAQRTPRISKMSPKWWPKGALEGPKNCPRRKFGEKVPTSTKPHYLLCFVKVYPYPKPWIFTIFYPQMVRKSRKFQTPPQSTKNQSFFSFLWDPGPKNIDPWGPVGCQFAPKMTPNLNTSPHGPPAGSPAVPRGAFLPQNAPKYNKTVCKLSPTSQSSMVKRMKKGEHSPLPVGTFCVLDSRLSTKMLPYSGFMILCSSNSLVPCRGRRQRASPLRLV